MCKRAFASWTDLTAHWKKKHGGQDEYKCDKVTHSLASHKKHILLHEEDKKKLKCFVCGHKFNFKSELDRHNVVHLSDCKHICPTRGCGKSFKMQSTLKRHQKIHDNVKINCPEEGCDYWTTLQHYLRDHLTQYHGPLLVCEYSLNVVLTLQGQDPLNPGMRNIVLSSLLAQWLRMMEETEPMVMTERKERMSKWQIIVLNSTL